MVKNKKSPLKDAGASRVSQTTLTSRAANATAASMPKNNQERKKINTQALKEIRKLQKTTHLLIPKAPFIRLVC
jgi:hypothetical protein